MITELSPDFEAIVGKGQSFAYLRGQRPVPHLPAHPKRPGLLAIFFALFGAKMVSRGTVRNG